MKALETKFASGLDIGQCFNRHEDLAINEYLTGVGLPAQPRGKIDDGANSRIIEPAFESDTAHGGKALRDTQAKAEFVAIFAPLHRELADLVPHFDRHANRAKRGVRTR